MKYTGFPKAWKIVNSLSFQLTIFDQNAYLFLLDRSLLIIYQHNVQYPTFMYECACQLLLLLLFYYYETVYISE